MFLNDASKKSPPPPESARDALRMMGGKRAAAAPSRAPGKSGDGAPNLFATGQSTEPSDEIDIKVKKSGWALPFFLGAAAGVAGVFALSKLMETADPKKESR
jgi:hypothetical protein